jgi:hypothetical protein
LLSCEEGNTITAKRGVQEKEVLSNQVMYRGISRERKSKSRLVNPSAEEARGSFSVQRVPDTKCRVTSNQCKRQNKSGSAKEQGKGEQISLITLKVSSSKRPLHVATVLACNPPLCAVMVHGQEVPCRRIY